MLSFILVTSMLMINKSFRFLKYAYFTNCIHEMGVLLIITMKFTKYSAKWLYEKINSSTPILI